MGDYDVMSDKLGRITERVEAAMAESLWRYADRMGEPLLVNARLRLVDHNCFYARILGEGEEVIVEVSYATIGEIDDLWDVALEGRILLDDIGNRMSNPHGAELRSDNLIPTVVRFLHLMTEKPSFGEAQFATWSGRPRADCNNASRRFFTTEGRVPLGFRCRCARRLNLLSWCQYQVANRA